MINQEKVRDMTRMAAYEDGDGEMEIQVSTYRKKDYVALQLVKAFIFGTIAYGIMLVFWIAKAEDFLADIDSMDTITSIGFWVLIIYFVFLAAYMVCSFFVARRQYDTCRRHSKAYLRRLRRVCRSYSADEDTTVKD